eukprot:GEMP01034201.1.p1 GENE.GEMP01034201.1~~GEMP01034201.1.p1  ORF type:complete len:366 (-),score=49.79 GEMP01034201.1:965-2062(-)
MTVCKRSSCCTRTSCCPGDTTNTKLCKFPPPCCRSLKACSPLTSGRVSLPCASPTKMALLKPVARNQITSVSNPVTLRPSSHLSHVHARSNGGSKNAGDASPKSSFYMRDLPSELVTFSSPSGQRLLIDCASASDSIPYFPLSEQFVTQESPPSCGAATITMVLNSLHMDPETVWSHPWRWYDENGLQLCAQKDNSKDLGISVEQFAYISECNGLHTSIYYADDDISIHTFREVLRRYVGRPNQKNAGARVVTCFSRSHLGQTGTGHYSPIGAYHEEKDMCLILDVARFKYPPYWVSVTQLWEAMRAFDDVTGKPRAFFVLQKGEDCDCSSTSSSHVVDEQDVPDAVNVNQGMRRCCDPRQTLTQ